MFSITRRLSRNRALKLSSLMSTEPVAKRTMAVKIGTHNGKFHCDEVLACFMLRQLPEYANAEIVRSRDQTVLDTCDIVVDVGGVYDPSMQRYDHHQRSFNYSMNSLCSDFRFVTKLSSAGLIYFHFGRRVLAQVLNVPEDNPALPVMFLKVYENFMEEVDACDNGINAVDGIPKFHVSTNLGSRVGYLNPSWNEPSQDETACFFKAYELVGTEFTSRVNYFYSQWLPARDIVMQAVQNRTKVHESGEIICIERFCPWKQHLYEIEKELCLERTVKFALYCDPKGQWRVQTVSVHADSFENRLPLHRDWSALRDDELCKVSGIPGCIFVHANLFIGGNVSYDGALQMAVKSLAARG
ncbi:MYG1 exonuclease-like [Sycon ciliatum]|uniref:MYG1 exonuclease-like n=1 Tax=Sycon ciliatum TaxID=27933 RepID=UPI0020AC55A2|eukprot:scpid71861/ scgid19750/ UPF0160 protein MYG1, mitochondrial; Protein Gamm1